MAVTSKPISTAREPQPQNCADGHGISSATLYKWRTKFGGIDASLMARLRKLEEENRWGGLKKCTPKRAS